MQNVTLSDPPADALAAIKARLRPRRIAWGAAAAPLVAGVLAFAVRQDAVGALLLLSGTAALLGLWLYCHRGGERRAQLEAGHAGEEAVRCALAGLDDRYYLLNGVTVPGERMEIDHLLVGPRGLFVLETKAHGGTIVYGDGRWWRLQAGARGLLQRRQIGNPSAQAQRNARLLRRYLAAHLGARATALPLVPIVVFTHPHAMLDADDAPIPVVHLRQLPALLQLYADDRLDAAGVTCVVNLLTSPSPSNDHR
jgi:Nuclease-related domain